MTCEKCGTNFEGETCPSCGASATSKEWTSPQKPAQQEVPERPAPVCPVCGKQHVSYQAIVVQESNALATVVAFLLAFFASMFFNSLQIPLLFPILAVLFVALLRRKTTVHTYAVCQECGHTRKVN